VKGAGTTMAGTCGDHAAKSAMATVLQRAASLGSCTTFVEAAQKAGLYTALSGEGPYTLFVPSDEAFKAMPKEQLAVLLQDSQKLAEFLKQHVVAGQMRTNGVEVTHALALSGSTINMQTQGENLLVNGARVVASQDDCCNGIVYVIDRVIPAGQSS
jgi:uncharacterized surface protein with fasciclin (FAS1) repeats